MCLLIANPKNKSIPLEVFEQATRSNSDGFGISYVQKDRVVIKKYAKLDPQAQFELVSKIGNVQMLHWRYATSGATCSKLAHPFRISSHMALAHNGVLPMSFPIAKGQSDTSTLVEQLRQSPATAVAKLRKHNFKGNKFAVLTPKKMHIVGEELGIWEDGVWYSNATGFEPRYKHAFWDDYQGGSDTDIADIYRRAQELSEDLAWALDDIHVPATDRDDLQELSDALDTFLYGKN